MRKKICFILAFAIFTCCLLVGCGEQDTAEEVKVYSFSGENEQYLITNGVIVLSEEQEIIYGGELKEKGEKISNIAFDSMDLYVLSDNEEITLSSFVSVDHTGDGFQLSNPGSVSGQISVDVKENLVDNLYYELSIETLDGEQTVYKIKMNVTEVTGMFEE